MFYILYQVTNNVNGKIYVGVHKTKKLDDGYMGSGKVINAAIAKYGIENFTRVILEQFDNSTAMFAREKEVVTDEFLSRPDTYNLRRGGFGGFDYLNSTGLNNSTKSPEMLKKGGAASKKKWADDATWATNRKKQITEQLKREHATGRETVFNNSALQQELQRRANLPEAIAKKKETWKKNARGVGENSSQFNTMWITNEISSKKIKKDAPIPEGWRKGRVIKPV